MALLSAKQRYGAIVLAVGAALAVCGAVAHSAVFAVGLVLVLVGLVAVVLARRAAQVTREAPADPAVAPLLRQWPLPKARAVSDVDFGATRTRHTDGPNPYVPRVADRPLRYALGARRFVVLKGEPKAGKSRTVAEAVRHTHPEADLVIPRSVADLGRFDPAVSLGNVVVLLDDLTAADLEHLTSEVLDFWDERAVLVGTISSEEVRLAGPARAALGRATVVDLPFELTERELAAAREDYPDEGGFTESGGAGAGAGAGIGIGIGEVLVGGRELVRRLRSGRRDSPAGQAIVRAAVDARLAGLRRPVTEPELVRLFPKYLERITVGVDPTEDVFVAGLAWATAPVASQVALLRRVTGGFEVLDYVVSAEAGGELPEDAWPDLLALTGVVDAYGIARAAYAGGRVDFAREGFRRAMEHEGSLAAAAFSLGSLLVEQDDLAAAERVYRRAVDSGDPLYGALAVVRLGDLLVELGKVDEAREVHLEAARSGNPEVAAWAKSALGG